MWSKCIILQSCVVGWAFRENAGWEAAKGCASMNFYLHGRHAKYERILVDRWFCGWMLISAVSDIQLGVAGADVL